MGITLFKKFHLGRYFVVYTLRNHVYRSTIASPYIRQNILPQTKNLKVIHLIYSLNCFKTVLSSDDIEIQWIVYHYKKSCFFTGKHADQAMLLRSLFSQFVVPCLDFTFSLVSLKEFSSLYLASVALKKSRKG